MDRAFDSHLDTLRFVCTNMKVNTVIEYGAGNYSTRLFHNLKKDYVSYEDDKEWSDKLQKEGLNVVYVKRFPCLQADLIFIDCGKTVEERIPIIKMHEKSPLVVIHDWDIPQYREVVKWDLVITDDRFPRTAICVNF